MLQLTATSPIVSEQYVRHARDSSCDDHFDFEDGDVEEGSGFVLARLMPELRIE